jgi:RNA polymerase sigma-70 factor, ECF subfamily
MDGVDDTGLLERARVGDEAAFSQLFAAYQRRLFRYAAYMCGQDAADDIVQDTFLVVLRQQSRKDRPTGSVIGYLIGIARHLAMKRHGRTTDWPAEPEELERVPTPAPNAFDQLATAESTSAIRAAVLSLPAVYREAVVLCELQDVDYETAASLMACPIGTVRSRLHRARNLLATKLALIPRAEVGEGR